MINSSKLQTLKSIAGAKSWSDSDHDIAPYLTDWRGRYKGQSPLVLKPATTREVQNILFFCNREKIPVLPQGGNTGLVGGSTPQGEIIISLERMKKIRKIDTNNESIICEAGVILQTVQKTASASGKLFPLALGAQGSAMVGGLISTNAGGVHVLRYGMMRDLVLGVEAIFANGLQISDLSGLRKNNTGYDLKQLLIGAEGTLGIVTAATLKLFPKPVSSAVAMVAVKSPAKAVALLDFLKSETGGGVGAFELMPKIAIDLVCTHVPGSRNPLTAHDQWSVLVEIISGEADRAKPTLEKALETAFYKELITDASIAQSQGQANDFWALRENIPEGEKKTWQSAKARYLCTHISNASFH